MSGFNQSVGREERGVMGGYVIPTLVRTAMPLHRTRCPHRSILKI